MLLFGTSGIEAWVAENNPQYANRIIKQLKAYKKANKLDDSYEPYKAGYGSIPSHAAANPKLFWGMLPLIPLKYTNTFFSRHLLKKHISKLSIPEADSPLNEEGILCYPNDPALPMKQGGSRSHLRCGLPP